MKKKELQNKKRNELLALAGSFAVRGRHKMKKAELIDALAAAGRKKPRNAKVQESVVHTEPDRQTKPSHAQPRSAKKAGKVRPPAGRASFGASSVQTTIKLIARDPFTIYCYWTVSPESSALRSGSSTVLRVHDITGIQFFGTNSNHSFDLALADRQGNRYIRVPYPDRTYCVELGVMTDAGYRCGAIVKCCV